jgi:hypothetical protein
MEPKKSTPALLQVEISFRDNLLLAFTKSQENWQKKLSETSTLTAEDGSRRATAKGEEMRKKREKEEAETPTDVVAIDKVLLKSATQPIPTRALSIKKSLKNMQQISLKNFTEQS